MGTRLPCTMGRSLFPSSSQKTWLAISSVNLLLPGFLKGMGRQRPKKQWLLSNRWFAEGSEGLGGVSYGRSKSNITFCESDA
ncbi:hypothetical protein NSND_60627 [Nitrospira sp. ND1]|nr:hypothetical protein NSND_60627 [Nitrospira sp. ND1]